MSECIVTCLSDTHFNDSNNVKSKNYPTAYGTSPWQGEVGRGLKPNLIGEAAV